MLSSRTVVESVGEFELLVLVEGVGELAKVGAVIGGALLAEPGGWEVQVGVGDVDSPRTSGNGPQGRVRGATDRGRTWCGRSTSASTRPTPGDLAGRRDRGLLVQVRVRLALVVDRKAARRDRGRRGPSEAQGPRVRGARAQFRPASGPTWDRPHALGAFRVVGPDRDLDPVSGAELGHQ